MTDRVTPEEDAALRRLHYFERLGFELAATVRAAKSHIRSRDKRSEIREPEDVVILGSDPRARLAQDSVRTPRRSH